jgi:NAD(P)-dependent dehydrogenase (short-subunit alcohol dehydrogenase family)
MDKQFSKGCVLIIGGSGGVGAACVERFYREKAKVVFTYNQNEQAAIELRRSCNDEVDYFQLTCQDSKQVKDLFNKIASQYQGINTLVNAAGFNIPQKFISEITGTLWRKVIDEDVNGFFNLVEFSLPYLRESMGSYVFISSAGLFKYPPGDVLSVAPKATIEHTIKGIAKEEGINGIRANSIALGVIDTGIFHRLLNEDNTFFDEKWHEAVMNTLAQKRFGKAEEVANTAYFLASSQASYITGHCIPVDGGYHI